MPDSNNDDKALKFKQSGDLARDDGQLDLAIECYQDALSINPDYWQVHANLSMVLADSGRYQDAINHAELAISVQPAIAELFDNLGNIQRLSKKYQDSVLSHKKAIMLKPELVSAYYNLGLSYEGLDDIDHAIRSLRKSLLLDGNQPIVLLHLADLYFLEENYEKSLILYEKTVSLGSYEVYLKLGIAYHHTENYEGAINAFNLAIQKKPDSSEAYLSLGISYSAINMIREAIDAYQKSVNNNPACEDGYIYLSDLLRKKGDLQSAIESAQAALNIRRFADGYIALGNAMNEYENLSGSVEAFKKALAMDPNNIRIASMLYHLKQKLCDWNGLSGLNSTINALIKTYEQDDLGEPFAAISRTDDLEQNLMVATCRSDHLSDKSKSSGVQYNHADHVSSKKKIRVGYLSSDICNHATTHLMLGVFREHNKRKFEIYTYSYGKPDNSRYRKEIIEYSDKFYDVYGKSDLEISNLIYGDHVDILIDLKGYTRDSRLGICALRPAPIQATYLGFPGTSGADFFDYVITDSIVTPIEHALYYSEKFVTLPDSYQCTDNHQPISDAIYDRVELDLPATGFVFCSFNRSYKLDPIFFDVWMRLLKAISNSVLWLYEANMETISNIRKEAVKRGVDPSRIVFAEKMKKEDHLRRMQLADLILDTRIYNGHTTTSDALWAGVPVVTMEGKHFASRVSSSLLHALEVPELVTTNIHEYESLALDLSQDPVKLMSIREKIERNRLQSPLFNTESFTLMLEEGYYKMWDRYRADQKPNHITVSSE